MYTILKVLLSLMVCCSPLLTSAQDQDSSHSSTFSLTMEYRPRTELRYGYRQLPGDTVGVAFLTSHRARINMDYTMPDLLVHVTLQDIRIWGAEDPRSPSISAKFYEFYVEPQLTPSLSLRVGRQRILYDDQRLFGENDWRQAGSQHDAVRAIYDRNNIHSEVLTAFNQATDNLFDTPYEPTWDTYKFLFVHLFTCAVGQQWKLTTLNYADGYEDPVSREGTLFKYTHGGRLEFSRGSIYLTLAGYYQHGKIPFAEQLSAYYLQPEVCYKHGVGHAFRAGLEIFSGDNHPGDGRSHAFLAQYGAFHRFNGRMDYTQRSVRTYNNYGLINPYLIQDFTLSKKTSLSWESHILASSAPPVVNENGKDKISAAYYGWENDLRFRFIPNSYTEIEVAYMFLLPDKSLEQLPAGAGGNASIVAQFAYIQVTWTPELLHIEK